MIAAERERQVNVEGWTPEHDSEHDSGEMALAAACYASPVPIKAEVDIPCGCREACCHHIFGLIGTDWRDPWPWDKAWDKRNKHPRIKQLVIAGALIAAEIDRLQRLAQADKSRTKQERVTI